MADRRGEASPHTCRWVLPLDGSGVDDGAVGGKAATIDRLVAAGFAVPASAAVTTEAYRRFLGQDEVQRILRDLPDVDELDDTGAEAERIADAFAAAPVPGEVADAVTRAARAIAGRSGGPGTVAARSSATVEDAEAASYAGQFDTALGCEPGDELLDAVRRVWASAWSPAVRAYRRAVGDEGELAMGVLLMDMLDARHAGVVFTRDPEERDRVRVETVEGLGEALVSGERTPERTLLSREDPAADLPDDAADFLAPVAETALAVERELGGDPQDLEWVHDGARVWIVQSRPITVHADAADAAHQGGGRGDGAPDDGFDTPLAGHTHTPAGVREMLPGVLPPLVWTMLAPRVEEGFRALFAGLGALPADELREGHRFLGRFRGRAALDLDLLRAAARQMPGQSEAELERQYFGEVISRDAEPTAGGGGLRSLRPLWRAARLRSAQRREAAVVNEAADRLLDVRPRLDALAPGELLRYHEAVLDLAARAVNAEVAVAALAGNAYRTLERFLENVVEEGRAAETAQRLTAGAIPACTATAIEVCGVVDDAATDPTLAAVLARADDDVLEELRAVDGGSELLRRLEAVVERAGSARVFGGPRWVDRPDAARSALRQALRRIQREQPDPQQRLAELEHRLTATFRWRLARVVTGQVVDVRIRLLRRMVGDAIELLGLREQTKRTVLHIGGETRRIVDHAAEGLVDQGRLGDPLDVALLDHHELLAAVRRGDVPSPAELDRRREQLHQMEALGELPERFDGRPARTEPADADGGDLLQGWGAGPGRHTGRAVVVEEGGAADLREGDVLVASATDPSWTPMFVTAGALVVERGGPLSHAAIVAREFGMPAVLNVAGATARLAGAEHVTVDGTAGTVEIHDREDADAHGPSEVPA